MTTASLEFSSNRTRGRPVCGRTAAVLSSFIATSQRLHIDPFTYLRDVFEPISAHPQGQLDQLLLDEWMAARAAAPP